MGNGNDFGQFFQEQISFGIGLISTDETVLAQFEPKAVPPQIPGLRTHYYSVYSRTTSTRVTIVPVKKN